MTEWVTPTPTIPPPNWVGSLLSVNVGIDPLLTRAVKVPTVRSKRSTKFDAASKPFTSSVKLIRSHFAASYVFAGGVSVLLQSRIARNPAWSVAFHQQTWNAARTLAQVVGIIGTRRHNKRYAQPVHTSTAEPKIMPPVLSSTSTPSV